MDIQAARKALTQLPEIDNYDQHLALISLQEFINEVDFYFKQKGSQLPALLKPKQESI